MNSNALLEYLSFINYQIVSQETLLEYHLKADALLNVLLGSNLPNYSYATIYHYLWQMDDTINQAKKLNENLLNELIKIVSSGPPKGSGNGNSTIH